MKTIPLLPFLLYCATAIIAIAQPVFAQSTNAQPTIPRCFTPIKNATGQNLPSAWAGGINTPMFGAGDLNGDGIADLAIFDRMGAKWLTFINAGTPNQTSYTFAPEYADEFPRITDWGLVRDYNQDGIPDIFTHSFIGIAAYRGYRQGGKVKFTLVTNNIELPDPYNPNFMTNIYVGRVDLPSIEDMDGDGDLDIVSYASDGAWVEYYKNMSRERGYASDSLSYKYADGCFGRFVENQLNSGINLSPRKDSCVNKPSYFGFRHAGSTILCVDVDGDGDSDALIGDIGFDKLTYLRNGLNKDSIWMTVKTTVFPDNTTPAQFESFLAAYHFDANNDGKKDLIVTSNDTKVNENINMNWLYTNSANIGLQLIFNKKNFLTEEIIDIGGESKPAFADIDNDGLKDLIIGGLGGFRAPPVAGNSFRSSLYLYKNVGTATAPAFQLITDDWLGLAARNESSLAPTFGDIDGDGAIDLLLGNELGQLIFLKNTAAPNQPFSFAAPVNNWKGIDIGVASVPQILDLDGDGNNDMVIGERLGNLNYYRNIGGNNFAFLSDSLGGVDMRNNSIGFPTGYATPCFYKKNGAWELLVGSDAGNMHRYTNITGNVMGKFTRVDSSYANIYEGTRSAPAATDLNMDGNLDFVIGNSRGGVALYSTQAWVAISNILATKSNLVANIHPNPTQNSSLLRWSNDNMQRTEIKISDVYGRLISEQTTTGDSAEIITQEWSSGIYFIKIILNNAQETVLKLVK